MPENVGALQVQLTADAVQLQAELSKAQIAVRQTAQQMGGDMRAQARQAKDSFELLGESVGVRLPRELRRALAEVPAIGSVVSLLFPVGIAGALAVVIGERLLPRLSDLAEYLTGAKESAREATEELKKFSDAAGKALLAAGKSNIETAKALQLSGLTGSTRTGVELQQVGEDLDQVRAQIRQTRDQIYALRNGFVEVTGDINGKLAPSLAALEAQESVLLNKQVLLNAQLRQEVAAEAGRAAEKRAGALREQVAATARLLEMQADLVRLNDKLLLVPANLRAVARPYLIPQVPQLEFPELVPPAPQMPLYSGTAEAAELNKLLTDQGERLKYQREMVSQSRDAAQQFAFEIEKLNIAFGDDRGPQYQHALAGIRNKYDETTIAIRAMGTEMGEAIQQGILMGRDWSDIFKTLLVDVIALIAKMTVLKQLQEASSAKGGGGPLGFLSEFLGGLFKVGGGRASGGPVYSGTSYIVGERGPEWFTPAASGYITPGGKAGGAGPAIQIDARGADASVERRIYRAMDALARQMPAIAVAAVREYSSRR